MKKKLILAVSVLMSCILFFSCTGPKGDEGPTGPQGPAGPEQPGLYFIRLFQNGVYSSSYTGQVESCIYAGSSRSIYYSNTTPIGLGVKDVLGNYRALLKFDLSSIPHKKIIVDKAELTIQTNANNYGGGAHNVSIHKITSYWKEFEAGNQVRVQINEIEFLAWNDMGGDFTSNTITPEVAKIDVLANSKITVALDPEVVCDWIVNTGTNYGLLLKVENETQLNNYAEIYPSGEADKSKRPMLKVWYYTVEQ